MKFIREELSQNPTFNTVVGLSNTSFDPENFIANRGATEGQIKVVHDMIKALQDWLDENGCSDDPYAIIKAKVDQLEAAIDECCGNPQDTLIQMLNDRMDDIEAAMDTCCRAMDDNAYQMLVDRLDELEAKIEESCQCGTIAGYTPGECDGNTITVSFEWNGSNPFTDGGKATAVSADPNREIAGYFLLVANGPGLYSKTSTYGNWSIDGNGNVQGRSGSSAAGLIVGVGASDTQGCEGFIAANFPTGFPIGG